MPIMSVPAPAKTTARAGAVRRTVAVDGSALRNGFGGPAAWCVYEDDGSWVAGGWPQATNNQAELTALLEALRHTHGSLTIITDSQYAINSATRFVRGWQHNGWRLRNGDPVKNREIIEAIVGGLAGRDVRLQHVPGHSGHRLNEAADTRARAFSSCLDGGRAPDRGPGLRVADVPPAPAVAMKAPASSRRRTHRPGAAGQGQRPEVRGPRPAVVPTATVVLTCPKCHLTLPRSGRCGGCDD